MASDTILTHSQTQTANDVKSYQKTLDSSIGIEVSLNAGTANTKRILELVKLSGIFILDSSSLKDNLRRRKQNRDKKIGPIDQDVQKSQGQQHYRDSYGTNRFYY